MKLLLVFAMVIVIASTTELRLCGKKLTFVLGRLCNHRYNAPTKEQMESHNGHRHYTRHGIAHDCCTNRCSYQYLKTYCAPDNAFEQFRCAIIVRSWLFGKVCLSVESIAR
ncbi:hypothetical protein Tcan_09982 [Toxocara canis]|uniref:Insulin-like domain-containing protein n=1 Tax=Toxocara canis TaxID=6265 RepID=A0A0B2UV24_TOXCA|nr:hypothetical protein Tcan_09982 [Toxocara canis]